MIAAAAWQQQGEEGIGPDNSAPGLRYPLGVRLTCVRSVTRRDVKLAFEPFGSLKSIGLQFTNRKTPGGSLNVFVEFHAAASAAAALQQHKVVLGGQEETVHPMSMGKYTRLLKKGLLGQIV